MKITPIAESKDMVDNKLELLKHLGEVQSSIKERITSDFILAKIPEERKEKITEMTSIAYFSSNIVKQIANKATNWKWNKKENKWYKEKIEEEQRTKIEQKGEDIFRGFMIRVEMLAILNRNVAKNHILKMLANEPEEDEQEKSTKGLLETIKENIKAKGG